MASPSKWIPIGTDQNHQPDQKQIKQTTIDIVGGIYCHICQTKFANKKEFDTHYGTHDTGNPNIVYTCVVCYKQINGYPSFRGHCYLVHVMKDKFKCNYCQKMFSKLCVLQSHVKSVHESANKCRTCQKEFQCHRELMLHKIIHQNSRDGPPYNCQTCGDQIETSDESEHHIEEHSTMFYSCPICNEDIPEIQNAASHLTKHFGEVFTDNNEDPDPPDTTEISHESSLDIIGGIFCIHCNNNYKSRVDFDNHFLSDHSGKDIVYACNICGKEYDKYLILANHCYDHTAKDRFECEECFKTFPRLSLLVIHMEAYHSDRKSTKGIPFTCLHCNHGYKSARRLNEHYRAIHNIYYYQCPESDCGKTFDGPKDLVLHLKQHKSVHNWCKQCGLRFYSMQACEKHIQVHKKKLYSCPICNRNYGEKYLVTKHLTQHFSTVLHVCKTCGKVYNSRSRLGQHMKVHNEIKPHNCTFCNKGFSKKYLLEQHLNIHTGEKPYKCTVCPKSFASYPNLRKHLKNIHNVINIHSKFVLNENNNQKNSFEPITESVSEKNFTNCFNGKYTDIVDNNNVQNTVMNAEKPISFDTVDINNAYNIDASNNSAWITDGLEPSVLEMLEGNADCIREIPYIDDVNKDLWESNPTLQELRSGPAVRAEPCEYGPEPLADDPPLAAVDPRLALPLPLPLPQSHPPPTPAWEPPLLTKLDYLYNFGVELNIDLF